MWKFNIIHSPGKTYFFADAAYRHPVHAEDDPETLIVAANLAAIAISIDEVAEAAQEDEAYWDTHTAMSTGQAPSAGSCKEYYQYRRCFP